MGQTLKHILVGKQIYGAYKGMRTGEKIISRAVLGVGTKYITTQRIKIAIKCSKDQVPDFDELLGTSEGYDWFMTKGGAERSIKAANLAIKLNNVNFKKYQYQELVAIAKILKLNTEEVLINGRLV
ncbi:hypothetical protein IA854_13605 [Listeria seeligeri]|uniref:hypothetical protein n=1 Tax=Listeria seeligeri TaxID=1640 RepID=UPI001627015A|nr:hypothetical protein [Listeria seeligeri]MBC1990364.1 hypothetical protein [Listeria seeligeri]MBF2375178.1 hypothetical protein [Listeria seeligeri]